MEDPRSQGLFQPYKPNFAVWRDDALGQAPQTRKRISSRGRASCRTETVPVSLGAQPTREHSKQPQLCSTTLHSPVDEAELWPFLSPPRHFDDQEDPCPVLALATVRPGRTTTWCSSFSRWKDGLRTRTFSAFAQHARPSAPSRLSPQPTGEEPEPVSSRRPTSALKSHHAGVPTHHLLTRLLRNDCSMPSVLFGIFQLLFRSSFVIHLSSLDLACHCHNCKTWTAIFFLLRLQF